MVPRGDSVDLLRKDMTNLASTISNITDEVGKLQEIIMELRIDRATMTQRTQSMEKKLDGLYNLGLWILGAFALAFLTGAANFIIRGGLNVAS